MPNVPHGRDDIVAMSQNTDKGIEKKELFFKAAKCD